MILSSDQHPSIYFLIDYEDDYVQPLILRALQETCASFSFKVIQNIQDWPGSGAPLLQWRQYESIDFDLTLHSADHLVNSYVIRKALLRKHYLSNTLTHWIAKHPKSLLKKHWKAGVEFEIDYAEFLDDALLEAFELRESLEKNESKDVEKREWWILKAGMSDRGQGIRLFSTFEELEAIFEEWEQQEPGIEGDQDGEPHEHAFNGDKAKDGHGTMTSQLRHFVAQPYIDPPLLLPSSEDRKFHIRTYVVAVGALQAYVYRPMLALFAAERYTSPSKSQELRRHLTNTCLQGSNVREGSVKAFWDFEDLGEAQKHGIYDQICSITGELFEAAARVSSIHFQPLPNAFEIFGLDFLVDSKGIAWLLEVNSFPDFQQTGNELQDLVEELFEGVVNVAIKPFFGITEDNQHQHALKQVLNLDLGRS